MKAKFLIAFFIALFVAKGAWATYPLYRSHFYSGAIVLRGSTDTIRGQVLLEPLVYEDNTAEKKIFAQHKGDIVVRQSSKYLFYPQHKVVFARLNYDQTHTDFRSVLLGQDTLLLRLLAPGKTDVCDGFLSPLKNIFEHYPYLRNQTIYLCGDGQPEVLPAKLFTSNYKAHILKFINRRYHSDLRLRDFKSNAEMFDYIAAHG